MKKFSLSMALKKAEALKADYKDALTGSVNDLEHVLRDIKLDTARCNACLKGEDLDSMTRLYNQFARRVESKINSMSKATAKDIEKLEKAELGAAKHADSVAAANTSAARRAELRQEHQDACSAENLAAIDAYFDRINEMTDASSAADLVMTSEGIDIKEDNTMVPCEVPNFVGKAAPAKGSNKAPVVLNYKEIARNPALLDKIDFVTKSLKELQQGEGIDVTGNAKLSKKLNKEQPLTSLMVNVYHVGFGKDNEYTVEVSRIPWNNATRIFAGGDESGVKQCVVKCTDKNGKDFYALTSKHYIDIESRPFVYADFEQKPTNEKAPDYPEKMTRYSKSVKAIRNGICINSVAYEYCGSSAAQVRTNKGVFIRCDFKVPEYYYDELQDSNYKEYLRTLNGAMALLEILTTGALSCVFTNNFYTWLVENKGKEVADSYDIAKDKVYTSVMKFMARAFLNFTASNPLGNIGEDWKLYHLGKVFVEGDQVKTALQNAMITVDGEKVPRYTEKEIDIILKSWKSEKLDGQGLVRFSAVKRNFKKYYGLTIKEDYLGKVLQYRIGSFGKGTLLVIDDKYLDACKDPDGKFIYRGQDIILEHNSWKHEIPDLYKGKIAPAFCLVSMSKQEMSHALNYQFIHFLDGYKFNPSAFLDDLKSIADDNLDTARKALVEHNYELAMMLIGAIDRQRVDAVLAELGADSFEMTLKAKYSKALAVERRFISDPYIKAKIYSNIVMNGEKMKKGRLIVDCAPRYIISDPTALLRTDLGTYNKRGLLDIHITDPSQIALQDPMGVFWDNQEGPCVLFRNPNSHAGEAQPHDLIGVNKISETLTTGYGDINVRELISTIREACVLPVFCNTLESLGGADTDGDQANICKEARIIKHRELTRMSVFCHIDKVVKEELLTHKSLSMTAIGSLRSDMVGVTTDYSTTWRDIQQHIRMLQVAGKKERIPYNFIKALGDAKAKALKNARNEIWVASDPSIMALVNLNVCDTNYDGIIECIDIMLETIKKLQETAIETPKSGVYVSYESVNGSNDYQHLCIDIRPSWLRPEASKSYKSLSPMGQLSEYLEGKWLALHDDMVKTAKSVSLLDKGLDTPDSVLQETVYEIRKDYGNTVGDIMKRHNSGKITEDEKDLLMQNLKDSVHTELSCLAVENGVSAVAIAAYDATYRSFNNDGTSCSFIWNCYFDEFMEVLKNSDDTQKRMYVVSVKEEYLRTIFPNATYKVAKENVLLNDSPIGHCKIADGEYDGVFCGGQLVLSVNRQTNYCEVAASLAGDVFTLVGMKYYKDENGNPFTKETAEQAIRNSNYIIALAPTGKNTDMEAYVIAGGKYIKVATSERIQTVFNNTVKDCFLKVALDSEAKDPVRKNIPSAIYCRVVDVAPMTKKIRA